VIAKAPGPDDLRADVRGGAEAVEAEPLGVAGETERAVPDQPGAEEQHRFEVAEAVRVRRRSRSSATVHSAWPRRGRSP
jgi:hypothetical protein